MSTSDRQSHPISDRIAERLSALKMRPLHLAKQTGIDNAIIYKCLNGKRNWTLGHLRLIAPILGVTVAELVQEPIKVFIAGSIRDGIGPSQVDINNSSTYRTLSLKDDEIQPNQYFLDVTDHSMASIFPQGSRLIVQKETSDQIKSENFVVYWAEDGQTYVRQIFFKDDEFILRGLGPGIPEKILPKKHLVLCDKIIRIEFPL